MTRFSDGSGLRTTRSYPSTSFSARTDTRTTVSTSAPRRSVSFPRAEMSTGCRSGRGSGTARSDTPAAMPGSEGGTGRSTAAVSSFAVGRIDANGGTTVPCASSVRRSSGKPALRSRGRTPARSVRRTGRFALPTGNRHLGRLRRKTVGTERRGMLCPKRGRGSRSCLLLAAFLRHVLRNGRRRAKSRRRRTVRGDRRPGGVRIPGRAARRSASIAVASWNRRRPLLAAHRRHVLRSRRKRACPNRCPRRSRGRRNCRLLLPAAYRRRVRRCGRRCAKSSRRRIDRVDRPPGGVRIPVRAARRSASITAATTAAAGTTRGSSGVAARAVVEGAENHPVNGKFLFQTLTPYRIDSERRAASMGRRTLPASVSSRTRRRISLRPGPSGTP